MLTTASTRSARTAALAALALALSLPPAGAQSQPPDTFSQLPYRPEDITNTHRSFANFNREVSRGFFVRPNFEVWAIHNYSSSLHRFDLIAQFGPTSVDPLLSVPTLANPIAVLDDPVGNGVLVVGGTTYGVLRHGADGAPLDFGKVGDEPGDALVDAARNSLWVSCMGDDQVWQLDLTTLTVT